MRRIASEIFFHGRNLETSCVAASARDSNSQNAALVSYQHEQVVRPAKSGGLFVCLPLPLPLYAP